MSPTSRKTFMSRFCKDVYREFSTADAATYQNEKKPSVAIRLPTVDKRCNIKKTYIYLESNKGKGTHSQGRLGQVGATRNWTLIGKTWDMLNTRNVTKNPAGLLRNSMEDSMQQTYNRNDSPEKDNDMNRPNTSYWCRSIGRQPTPTWNISRRCSCSSCQASVCTEALDRNKKTFKSQIELLVSLLFLTLCRKQIIERIELLVTVLE